MAEPQTPFDEPAHDVLAADEFAMPVRDPSLHQEPVALPDDPSGIAEPHDVLAAEEFAMPATRPRRAVAFAQRSRAPQLVLWALVGVALAWIMLRFGRGD
jgi:hypothetical protein